METLQKKFLICATTFFFLLLGVTGGLSASEKNLPILIISSYNPETSSTSSCIQAFQSACDSIGIKNVTIIENMNCKNFSESRLWKARLHSILSKYVNADGKLNVSAILLLGQESWSAYISQDMSALEDIPVVVGMISSNGLILPNEEDSLSTWMPTPLYFKDLYERKNILSGLAYEYNIANNVAIVKEFYPNVQNIALLTDNTFGGVVLQSHVKEEMLRYKELNLILLDGRVNDIYEIQNQLATLPENTALFLGTWRVDKRESYFLTSSLYAMSITNTALPVFSLSTLGLGNWAIGGDIPNYKNQGCDLAKKVKEVLSGTLQRQDVSLDIIPSHRRFDLKKVKELGLNESLTKGAIILNDNKSLLAKYPMLLYVIMSVLSVLAVAFILVSAFLIKTKRLNLSLMESENSNRLILNNIGVGLFFINQDFEIVWENCSLVEELSHWYTLAIGKKCYCSKLGSDTPCDTCPAVKYKAGKQTLHEEVIERRNHRVFSLLYTPIQNQDNEYTGCVVRIEDITLREKTNMELQEAKDAAVNADKLKSLFLANMSHEIRTPLNAIVGFSELLADMEDPNEKKEFVKIIEANNKQLLQLINDILDLSKIEAGTLEFHMEQVNITQIIEEVYQVFESTCHDKGLKLLKDIPITECSILSDRNRIAQVVSNFITNALKFTSRGHIKLGFVERQDDVKIFVEDTG
ncbi:MAG: histidine kinase dimerization/phospho-acceptor domain-containing protein, partial [Bacteroidales bacterium]